MLTLLNGVSWPTASVILHFCHQEAYPILDVRALWTLGVEASQVPYNFELWWAGTRDGFVHARSGQVIVAVFKREPEIERPLRPLDTSPK